MRPGARIGFHAEQASQTIPIMQIWKAAGVEAACLLAMENPGLGVDARQIFPSIVIVDRWHHPNHEYEGGGTNVADWPLAKRLDFARTAIDLIFTRTNDTEYSAADYFCPGLNEWDPPGVEGWRAFGEILLLLCQEATNRSPEMERLGLHPIRLAIPGFNNGTPEWAEMQAMKATGIFDVMKARGDILIIHEGLWWNQGMNDGMGDLIPGAPRVPRWGGSKIGRVNYWTEVMGIDLPFMTTEWYDGGTADFTPVATRAAYIANYDKIMRHNPHYLGSCPFEVTDLEAGPWTMVDFTEAMKSEHLMSYMISERNKPNPTLEVIPMPLPPHNYEGFYMSKWQGRNTATGFVYQGDLKQLAPQSKFGFFWGKATQGTNGIDSLFDEFLADAPRAGKPYGAFHFFVNAEDPIQQARNFFRVAGGAAHPFKLRPAYDFEDTDTSTGASIEQRMLDFVLESDRLWGVKGIIYTRKTIWNPLYRQGKLTLLPQLSGRPWWVAHYNTSITEPWLPIDAPTWHIWQIGNRPVGDLPGVPAVTTLDLLNPAFVVADLCYPVVMPPVGVTPGTARAAALLAKVAADLSNKGDVGHYTSLP